MSGPKLAQAGASLRRPWRRPPSGKWSGIAIDAAAVLPKALMSLDRLTAGAICRALRKLKTPRS